MGERPAHQPEPPGQPLQALIAAGPQAWQAVAALAIAIARLLAPLHAARQVHGHIDPAHIVVGADGLPVLRPPPTGRAGPGALQSSSRLHYIAPEQTGRINRSVDHRADLYSLGATLHALLTGAPPFADENADDLVHCHIAKPPRSPQLRVPELPEALSAIVLKLLAKDADERYQSAHGLIHDLALCLRAQRRLGHVPPFAPGRQDVAATLRIPQRPYGREQVLAALLQASERCARGGQELLLISGYTGVGKSTLVHELRQTLLAGGSRFASGKFEQYRRNRPYAAILQALQGLIRELLAGSAAELARWRERLQARLGVHLVLLLRQLPELAHITGTLAEPPGATPDGPNRQRLLARLLSALADRQHPLVLFLDDLQWADPASLQFIEVLARAHDLPYLLLVTSCRQSALDDDPALADWVARLRSASLPFAEHRLAPLQVGEIGRLLADTLRRSPRDCAQLAAICHEKTQGNPFFLVQLLQGLHQDKLVRLQGRSWVWDEAAIRDRAVDDDVVALMIGRIRQLPLDAQAILSLAACVGNRFSPELLQAAGERPTDVVQDALVQALDAGLIVTEQAPLGTAADPPTTRYRFVHDRVQQAAYSLLAADARSDAHLHLGRLLQARCGEDAPERLLFETVGHLNHVHARLEDTQERIALARLNLVAGSRARESAAFDSALDMLDLGLALLPHDAWLRHPELTLELHLAGADAAALKGDFARMEALLDRVRREVRDPLAQARAHGIRIQALVAQSRFEEGLEVARAALALLGQPLPARAGRTRTLLELLRTRALLRRRDVDSLPQGTQMRDPRMLAALSVLSRMFGIVKFSSSSLRPLVMAREVALILRHGLTDAAGTAFAGYGGVLCGGFDALEEGYRVGRIALALDARAAGRAPHHKTLTLFNSYVRHYHEPLADCRDALLESHRLALDCGDTEYAAYSLAAHIQYAFPLAQDYAPLQAGFEAQLGALRQTGQRQSLQYTLMALQAVANLRGETEDPLVLDGAFYREQTMLAEHAREHHRTAICVHHSYKALLAFVLGDDAAVLAACAAGLPHLAHISGTHSVAWFLALEALALMRSGAGASRDARARIRRTLRRTAKWAHHCPANHSHRLALLEAGRARLHGRHAEALEGYDRAIALATRHGFALDAAIACELAADFLSAWERPHIARGYLDEAAQRFGALGATAKLAQLRRAGKIPAQAGTTDADIEAGHPGRNLELDAVISASQAISDEIVLERLLARLMHLALVNAGGQRGALVLNRNGQLHLEVETDPDGALLPPATRPLEHCSARVPVGIINYVARTGEAVVLDDAGAQPLFAREAYVTSQRPRALLCLPILYHGMLTAILYLEHRHSRAVFDRRRLETLRILAAQAAISIENAKLYESLQASEREYRSLFENAIEGIFRVAPSGRCISANPALAGMLGFDSPERFLATVEDVGTQCFADPADMRRFLAELNRNARISDFETRWRRRDGSLVEVSVSARRVRDGDGLLLYVEGSLTDVGERKARERAERARQRAEGENQAKSLFLATMSHEIRTPMNGILGMAQLLLRAPLPANQRERVEAIQRSGAHLLSILNDVLDFSKIEAGQMTLASEPFALQPVFDALAASLRPQAEERRLALSLAPAPIATQALVGDQRALTQILLNLLTNALKFTAHGHVRLRCDAERLEPEHTRLRFEVEDSGAGIPVEAQARIFAHFSQADGSITRRYGGTGLGLAICRRLVELQHGEIGVTSTPGVGSTFWFALDYPLAPLPPPPAASPVGARRALDVLLVEDVEINRQVVCGLLELGGHRVELADDAAGALHLHDSARFDVVLMDIHLPDMSGVEVARRMRAHADPARAGVRIVALTASVTSDETARYLDAGMNAVIGKPVMLDALEAALHGAAQAPPPATSPPPADDTIDLAVVRQHLSLLGDERFAGLVASFPALAQAALEELAQAGSAQQRQAALHRLAGSAANYGLGALAARCRALEERTEGDPAAELRPLLHTSLQRLAALDPLLARALRPAIAPDTGAGDL